MKIRKIVNGKTSNMDIFKALIECKQGNYRTKQLMQCKINDIFRKTNIRAELCNS